VVLTVPVLIVQVLIVLPVQALMITVSTVSTCTISIFGTLKHRTVSTLRTISTLSTTPFRLLLLLFHDFRVDHVALRTAVPA
jgi:hypothetical protein